MSMLTRNAVAILLLAFSIVQAGEAPPVPRAAPVPLEIPRPALPITLPDGPSQAGWEAFVKNDFAAAESSFRDVLKKDPRHLPALEGLRAVMISQGKYKESQSINLEMVAAAADSPACHVYTSRASDAMQFVESRADVIALFEKMKTIAEPAVASAMKDQLATLYFRQNNPELARKSLDGLGYVNYWQFVAGPFGSHDRNNPIERRFEPERALTDLEFTDGTSKDGKKTPVHVHKDLKVLDRDLNINTLLPGARGIFYAFTNLESERDQDVILGVLAPLPYRAWLRGMPVLQEPEDEQTRRAGGELIRTHLIKGSNPLLIKMALASNLTVRVMSPTYAPLKDVTVKPLPEAALAKHSVSALRGFVLSEKTSGALAAYLQQQKTTEKAATPPTLKSIAENGALNFAEASWLDMAAQRESDATARQILARRIAGSFPDSVAALDLGATILRASGQALGNSEGRESEEARQLRERALTKLPTSHQNLLALYFFFTERNLNDQAFEKIKACTDAHPKSPLAIAELGESYLRKQFMAEAERCFEKAADLDTIYVSRLIFFHESHGNKVRARALRQKQIEQGLIDADYQFELALKHGDLDQAEKLLAAAEQFFPDQKDDHQHNRVRLLLERGAAREAYNLQKKLYLQQPSFHGSRRASLLSLVDLALRLNLEDEARALINAFLKEHPGDIDLRQRLSELEGKLLPRWWEPYDVKVSQLDTSQFTNIKYPSANHAWIVDFMVTRVQPDMSAESYVHIAQKVLNLQGINELSELLVRAQREDIVYVRTVNPDGSVFQPQNVHDFNLAQSASLYKVAPGSILEHAYLMRSSADEDDPSFSMAFNFYAVDSPRAVSRWVVLVPNELKDKLNIRRIHPELIEEKTLEGPPGFTVYQWTNNQVEGLKFEPLMPVEQDQESIPMILLESASPTYRATNWLMRRDKDDLPAEAIEEAKRIALRNKAKGETAIFQAIVQWVIDSINTGSESRSLHDVWFSRIGRPDQMLTLAREMALAADLKVRTAYINGAYAPGRIWKSKNARRLWEPSELASFGSGGRMLVLEPSLGPDRWAQIIGRTPEFYSQKDLNNTQAGALAMTLGDDGARIKRVNGEMLGITAGSHRMTVTLDESGTGNVQGLFQLFGNLAGGWRESLADPRQQNQIKEYIVRYAWPKTQINEIKISGENRGDAPLVFNYSTTAKGLGAPAGDSLFLPAFLTRPRLLDFRGQADRQHDMLIKEEVADLDHTITYVAPAGHGWTEVPEDVFIVTEFGFYLVDFNVQGRTLTATRSYLMPAQRITPDKYPKMLEFLRQISAHNQQRIGYGKLDATTFGTHPREIFSSGYASQGEEKRQ